MQALVNALTQAGAAPKPVNPGMIQQTAMPQMNPTPMPGNGFGPAMPRMQPPQAGMPQMQPPMHAPPMPTNTGIVPPGMGQLPPQFQSGQFPGMRPEGPQGGGHFQGMDPMRHAPGQMRPHMPQGPGGLIGLRR